MSSLLELAEGIDSAPESSRVLRDAEITLKYEYHDTTKTLTVKNSDATVGNIFPENIGVVETIVLSCTLPKNCKGLFKNTRACKIVTVKGEFDSSKLEDASEMFAGSDIEEIDFTDWNFSSLETADEMFYGCDKLVVVKMQNKEFPMLKSASAMFMKCKHLGLVDTSGVSMSKVLRVDSMFAEDESLISCNTNTWNIYRGALKIGMFAECASLEKKHLATWAQEELCWT